MSSSNSLGFQLHRQSRSVKTKGLNRKTVRALKKIWKNCFGSHMNRSAVYLKHEHYFRFPHKIFLLGFLKRVLSPTVQQDVV